MEDFALRNAMITAEGALMLAIRHTRDTLCGLSALVLGFGRVGSVLTRRLLALGAHVRVVSVCERERAQADCDGATGIALDDLAQSVVASALVINTIPAPVLPGSLLDRLPEGAAVIDLATAPGCSPGDERVIRAPGLPGKTAPRAAARAMMRCIVSYLERIE
jgi:dipicolinate synthase subunit A